MARPVSGSPPARPARPASRRLYQWGAAKRAEQARTEPAPPGTGWTILSYLLSGIVAYGAIGWLVARAVHLTLLFPAGMLIGLGISIGFVIHRYGRP